MKDMLGSRLYTRLAEFIFKCKKNDVDFHIALVLLDKVENIADINISEISYLANTTPASVSRFCKKIGYQSFAKLKSDIYFYGEQLLEDIPSELAIADKKDFFLQRSFEFDKSVFNTVNHTQIQRIAKSCSNAKKVAIIGNSNAFVPANFLREVLTHEGIHTIEINRHANVDILEYAINNFDIVFIISLSGDWIKEKEKLLKSNDSVFKCLLTFFPREKDYDFINEIVSFSDSNTAFSSVYYSQRIMMLWISQLWIYIKENT